MEGTGQQQQQQHHQPTVVIVQQPVVLGSGHFSRGQPFLRRGVKLNNGTNIGINCISILGVAGMVLTFMGLVFTSIGINVFVGILMILAGGGMLAACFKFCHKAKQDYDALPQDHPDRVIYSTPVFQPHRSGGGAYPIATTTATYQLPPGTQVINATSVPGAQYLGNNQLPDGSQLVNPSSSSLQSFGSYPHGNLNMGPQYPGAMSFVLPQQTKPPVEDNPPSYDEVCKQPGTQFHQ